MERPIILLADPDGAVRRMCESVLSTLGADFHWVATGAEALRFCGERPVALVAAEAHLPDMGGIEMIEQVKASHPATDVLLLTAHPTVDFAVQALKKGAVDYLRKPLAAEDFSVAVTGALEQRRLYRDNDTLLSQLRLYELSRPFAAMEEPSRVAEVGLAALLERCGGVAGFCLVREGNGGAARILAEQGIAVEAPDDPGWDAALVTALLGEDAAVRAAQGDAVRKALEGIAPFLFDKALTVAVAADGETTGIFVILRMVDHAAFEPERVSDAEFLGAQIGLSFKMAHRFQQARGLAFIDSLTDLYNASYLQQILETHVDETTRSGEPLSLLFLDLDNFREVNRLHGHQAGSRALIEAGRIIRRHVRDKDEVVRYGGDEFVIVLPNTPSAAARRIAERLGAAFRKHMFLTREGKNIQITTCIGFATVPEDATTPQGLILLADKAMYLGKEASRDAVFAASALEQ